MDKQIGIYLEEWTTPHERKANYALGVLAVVALALALALPDGPLAITGFVGALGFLAAAAELRSVRTTEPCPGCDARHSIDTEMNYCPGCGAVLGAERIDEDTERAVLEALRAENERLRSEVQTLQGLRDRLEEVSEGAE